MADKQAEQLKQYNLEKKAEISKLLLEAGQYRKELSAGAEEKLVDADMFPDYADDVMRYIDPATGEIVWTRPLMQHERQTFINNGPLKKLAGE